MAAANERAAGERQKNTFEAERAFFGFSPVEFVDDVCEPAPQLAQLDKAVAVDGPLRKEGLGAPTPSTSGRRAAGGG